MRSVTRSQSECPFSIEDQVLVRIPRILILTSACNQFDAGIKKSQGFGPLKRLRGVIWSSLLPNLPRAPYFITECPILSIALVNHFNRGFKPRFPDLDAVWFVKSILASQVCIIRISISTNGNFDMNTILNRRRGSHTSYNTRPMPMHRQGFRCPC